MHITSQAQNSSHGDTEPPQKQTARLLKLATAASVAAACLLITAKTFAYVNTDAVSILASLLDSIMDAGASLLNLIAVRYALTPADKNHRFGHGKAESLAALFQAGFILASSAFLIHEAFHRLLAPVSVAEVRSGVVVILLAMTVTTLLVAFQRHVVRQTGSMAIHADSVHYRADLLSNAATLLALLLAGLGLNYADPIFALLIAGYLLVSTREILRQALNELLDRELPEAQQHLITEIALAHPEVRGMHDLRTRRSGRTPIMQLHLEMDADITLRQAHHIADEVEEAISKKFPEADIVVHQDPVGVVETQRWQSGE